jgi:hypothetical protein
MGGSYIVGSPRRLSSAGHRAGLTLREGAQLDIGESYIEGSRGRLSLTGHRAGLTLREVISETSGGSNRRYLVNTRNAINYTYIG